MQEIQDLIKARSSNFQIPFLNSKSLCDGKDEISSQTSGMLSHVIAHVSFATNVAVIGGEENFSRDSLNTPFHT